MDLKDKEFRVCVKKLYVVVSNLTKVWDFEPYNILTVLLQNLYSTENNDVREKIIISIRLLSEYRGKHCYMSTFVVSEINMIKESVYYSEY